ncbi:acyl-coenzyme A diphosphatase FITM2-like [Ylistrum balloti]|uniref:acyl-coenzyme A diphosphatase FITM2-like n=1 Tax=Ylistrum balloti TaxID=509963 RepID=UPI002905A28F|nr:acyl-coenzyme A diphosphatase FITM2-like [Ylistrum balloti]
MAGMKRQPGSTGSQRFNDQRKMRGQGKKPLPPPTHVGHFFLMVIMKICKKILLADTAVKIGVYLIGVMVGSILADVVALPRSYFSDSHNIFNQLFVKLGWGWTLTSLSLFTGMTSFVYTLCKWPQVKLHFLRLALATFWWYAVTSVFNYVESVVGICTELKYSSRFSCNKAGQSWLGFDMSGHVFLLIHNLLTISEEVKFFKDWTKLENILENENLADQKNLKESDIRTTKQAYKELTPYIKLNVIFLAALTVLWEFMLIISTVYRFHTLPQKVSAAFIAVGCWFISYRMIVRSNCGIVHSGSSPLRFTKCD